MATYPYISGPGNVAQMITQLRKAFPASVSSETVKKLGLAPNNESYVISALQFLGLIDAEGKKTPTAGTVFSAHKDEDFAQAFEATVKKAYAPLFDLRGDGAWSLPESDLVTFFRRSDQTSDTIGRRQARVFKMFAGLSGHGEAPTPNARRQKVKTARPISGAGRAKAAAKTTAKVAPAGPTARTAGIDSGREVGLSVRIEINLPADGTKETYDNIFRSIRENLLNG